MLRRGWPLILVLLLMAGCDSGADSGAAPENSVPANIIKPPPPEPVKVGDAAEGKRLAQRCAKCHGVNGVSARSGSPFIAGLEQEYLVKSILAYKDGTRKNESMHEIADTLNALQLADVTAWYASLDTPWKGAVATEKSKAILQDKNARAAAEKLIPSCSSCHNRAALFRQDQAIPTLAGISPEYFTPALKSYFDDKRHSQIMAQFKLTLDDAKIYNLGAYYASAPTEKAPPPTEGNPTKGKESARHCAGCHGYDGNSLNPSIPNLAGQTADYLRKAIKNYRDGQRSEELMRYPVRNLSDATVANLAAYFALQQPEPQLRKDITSPHAFNPLEDGARIAPSCDSCHGKDGNSSTAGIPNLSGLSVRYIASATADYQSGRRKHPAMQQIVSFFSDTDIEKIAYHYAMQAPHQKQKATDKDTTKGEQLSSACTMCHGEKGISKQPDTTPSLAGQNAAYLINATQGYASGKRQNQNMSKVARELKPEDLKEIAAYFASQPPAQVQTWLPEEPSMIVDKKCSRCHGDRGYSTRLDIPRLAGQSEPYIILTIREYQDGVRKDTDMEAMAHGLSMIEIKAIAAYYARQ